MTRSIILPRTLIRLSLALSATALVAAGLCVFVHQRTKAQGNSGALSFSQSSYSVIEGKSTTITVTRTGGSANQVTAKIGFTNLTTTTADYVAPAPGSVDGGFTPISPKPPNAVHAVAVQPDGKIVYASLESPGNNSVFLGDGLGRLNANGTADASFNPTIFVDEAYDLAIQPDGKIIFVGTLRNNSDTSGPRVCIVRLNSDGSVDPTFIVGTGFNNFSLRAVVIQPDGKVIVGGQFPAYNGVARNNLVRLNSDGSLDSGFVTGTGPDSNVEQVVLQPDGKIIIGGRFTSYNGTTRRNLARVNADGSLDTSFVTSPTGDDLNVFSLALQPDGKLIAGGFFYLNSPSDSTTKTPVLRFNSDGSLDSSFSVDVGHKNATNAIVVQPDGKIILGGSIVRFPLDNLYFLNRLNSDGSPDLTFTSSLNAGSNSGVEALALQPDGKLVLGGQFTLFGSGGPARYMSRLNGDVLVTWAAGDAADKTFTFVTNNDSELEQDESLRLTLTPIQGGATTGVNGTATLTIVDNDTRVTNISGTAVYGGPGTLTATLSTMTGALSGKTISFSGGSINATAVTDANGVATATNVNLNGANAGTISFGASFAGDDSYSASSGSGNIVISKAPATLTISSSANPSDLGQSVNFTALLTPSGGGTPSGSITFKADGNSFSFSTVNANGTATGSSGSLTVGTHSITAELSSNNFTANPSAISQVVKPQPTLSISDASIAEGDSGTKALVFNVTLSPASALTVTATYSTAAGSATAGVDYQTASGPLSFSPATVTQTVSVPIIGDVNFEPDETLTVTLANPGNATINKATATGTIQNDDAQGGFISFHQSNYAVSESDGFIAITVDRTNDVSRAATVDYATDDTGAQPNCAAVNGLASSRCDFIRAAGTISFAAGEVQKTFSVFINRDSYGESPEAFTVNLSNPAGGALLGTPFSSTVTIAENSLGLPANAIDDASIFVRMHYHDFLNREPDQSGLDFWTAQITSCGSDPACTQLKRVNVSAAFLLSIEFQQTGFLVERMHKVAYGDGLGNSTLGGAPHSLAVPIVRVNQFLQDTQRIGRGVVVLAPGWQQALENNKRAYALEFVQSQQFINAFPFTMTPAAFVDRLDANAGRVLTDADRAALITAFGSNTTFNQSVRGQTVRYVADTATLISREFNRALVLSEYFGYLRRNPNDAPEIGLDYTGYEFWLNKLNQANGDPVKAELVKAFISSSEYRQRFGP